MEVVIDKFGRIIIPKQIREHLGLSAGSKLKIEEQDHELHLAPLEDQSYLTYENDILVYTGRVRGNLDEVLKRQREMRLKKLDGFEDE